MLNGSNSGWQKGTTSIRTFVWRFQTRRPAIRLATPSSQGRAPGALCRHRNRRDATQYQRYDSIVAAEFNFIRNPFLYPTKATARCSLPTLSGKASPHSARMFWSVWDFNGLPRMACYAVAQHSEPVPPLIRPQLATQTHLGCRQINIQPKLVMDPYKRLSKGPPLIGVSSPRQYCFTPLSILYSLHHVMLSDCRRFLAGARRTAVRTSFSTAM